MQGIYHRNIMHVTHPWGGGIQTYLEDMVRMFGDSRNIYFLISDQGNMRVVHANSGKVVTYRIGKAITLTDYHCPAYRDLVRDILVYFDIDLVHLNSMVGHTFDLIEVTHQCEIPIVCTVHDYYFICPTFHMVKSDGSFCETCEIEKVDLECLAQNSYLSYSGYDREKLAKWRDEFRKISGFIDEFVFPSAAARTLFEKYFKIEHSKAVVIMHGDSIQSAVIEDSPASEKLRVGVIGSLWKHKGFSLVEYIVENNDDEDIVFFHFGDTSISSDKLTKLGRYEQNNIVSLLKQYQIDVLLILSTWPETFSYTLSEAIKADIPPIVTNLGATCERVDALGIGWVVDYQEPRQTLELLGYLKDNRHEIETKKNKLRQMEKQSLEEMKQRYIEVYTKVSKGKFPAVTRLRRASVMMRLKWRQIKFW